MGGVQGTAIRRTKLDSSIRTTAPLSYAVGVRIAACLGIALMGLGCGSFDAAPAPDVVEGGSGDAAPAEGGSGDAADVADAGEGGRDGGSGPAPLTCGASFCKSPETCCVGKTSRSCAVGCPGLDLGCLATDQCAAGQICCFGSTGTAARCRTECKSGHVLCGGDADCAAAGQSGACQGTNCTDAAMNFRVCARGGTRFIDLPNAGTCTLP